MENNVETRKKQVYKKWWFWVVLLSVMLVIGITINILTPLVITTTRMNKLASIVQEIDKKATIYTSIGENTLIIELPNYTTKKHNVEAIEIVLKGYASESEILHNYSKVILCEKINPNEDKVENYFISPKVYSLPDMTQDIDAEDVYIDFVKFIKIK